jgi:hypothetical protein
MWTWPQVESPARLPKMVSFNTAPRRVGIPSWDGYPVGKRKMTPVGNRKSGDFQGISPLFEW